MIGRSLNGVAEFANRFLGADCGAPNSCIALFKYTKVCTVLVQSGSSPTKSVIFFSSPQAFGQTALQQQESIPAKVVSPRPSTRHEPSEGVFTWSAYPAV